MKEVVFDKEWFKKTPKNMELYYMYRGIKKKDDLRYDITVIPGQILGQEFVKTKGHRHPCEETYKVLEGQAVFLLQKVKGKIVEDVYAIKAKKGDKVNIPSNYDHLVINPSNQELKIGNWVSEKSGHNYGLLQKMKGACYFYIKDPASRRRATASRGGWIKNKNYKKIPKLQFEKPK